MHQAVPLAFPSADELILDGEALMCATDGTILPFGAQGKHEQKKHAGAVPCLRVFDLLWYNGQDLTGCSQRARREKLEALLQVPLSPPPLDALKNHFPQSLPHPKSMKKVILHKTQIV